MTAPVVDVAGELLTHLRGRGHLAAAELVSLARDSAHEDYRRAVCRLVARELGLAAQVEMRREGTFARMGRPRLRRECAERFATLMALQRLAVAYADGDARGAAEALAAIGAA